MNYSMYKDIPKINVNKAIIKEFYTTCITYLDKTCFDANYTTTVNFDFKLTTSDMTEEYNSFEKFNNEVLSDAVFSDISVSVRKINVKTLDVFSIRCNFHSYNNSLQVSSHNKLWVDETTLEFQKFFSDIYDGGLSSQVQQKVK